MVAAVVLVSVIAGFVAAAGFAVAGASLTAMLAGYFLAGTTATMLMLFPAGTRDRTHMRTGRKRGRGRIGSTA